MGNPETLGSKTKGETTQVNPVREATHLLRSTTYLGQYGYGSIPIDTIFSGMNIHLPAILMFTRGTRF
jgi:hypothetical protein